MSASCSQAPKQSSFSVPRHNTSAPALRGGSWRRESPPVYASRQTHTLSQDSRVSSPIHTIGPLTARHTSRPSASLQRRQFATGLQRNHRSPLQVCPQLHYQPFLLFNMCPRSHCLVLLRVPGRCNAYTQPSYVCCRCQPMTYLKSSLSPSGSLRRPLDSGLLLGQVLTSHCSVILHWSVKAMLHWFVCSMPCPVPSATRCKCPINEVCHQP